MDKFCIKICTQNKKFNSLEFKEILRQRLERELNYLEISKVNSIAFLRSQIKGNNKLLLGLGVVGVSIAALLIAKQRKKLKNMEENKTSNEVNTNVLHNVDRF
jgi:hypothetical protein